jgi:hypothetical protein
MSAVRKRKNRHEESADAPDEIDTGLDTTSAYRKALAWLGHSSSDMLDLYYHLHDEDSQETMRALAGVPAPVAQ